MRTDGMPSAPTVARAMPLGSLGSDFSASAYQASNWRNGSPQGCMTADSVLSGSVLVISVAMGGESGSSFKLGRNNSGDWRPHNILRTTSPPLPLVGIWGRPYFGPGGDCG